MSSLFVSFMDVGTTRYSGLLNIGDADTVVSETINTSGVNAQSAAATRSHVRVVGDAAHWVATGSNPDATVTTGRIYLPSGVVEYFEIDKGNKIAAVTA